MSKQVLDRLQMRHLKELGISANNASAYWHRVVRMNTNEVVTNWFVSFSEPSPCLATMKVESIKTYTLQDILDALPKEMTPTPTDRIKFKLCIYDGAIFYCFKDGIDDILVQFRIDENRLIDAAYEMLCWLIENGYIETNKQ